jgi:type I restriction enzyme S subunit
MPDPIGRACLAPDFPYPAITAVDVTMMDPDVEMVSASYLVSVLNTPGCLEQASRLAGGATRQRVSRKNLEQVLVPVPPRETQDVIAAALRQVDDKIHAEQQRREALQSLFASLLGDLMTSRVRVDHLAAQSAA